MTTDTERLAQIEARANGRDSWHSLADDARYLLGRLWDVEERAASQSRWIESAKAREDRLAAHAEKAERERDEALAGRYRESDHEQYERLVRRAEKAEHRADTLASDLTAAVRRADLEAASTRGWQDRAERAEATQAVSRHWPMSGSVKAPTSGIPSAPPSEATHEHPDHRDYHR